MIRLHTFCAAALAAGLTAAVGAGPASAEKMTYLFPAPPILPSFGPLQLAKQRGYFKAAGLDVAFATAKGGVDVAKQVGVGNAEMGGGLADSPIIVRAQGIPVRSVAAFGGPPLYGLIGSRWLFGGWAAVCLVLALLAMWRLKAVEIPPKIVKIGH